MISVTSPLNEGMDVHCILCYCLLYVCVGICFRNDDPEVFYTAGRDGLMVRYVYSRPTYRPQKSFNPVVVDVGVHGCLLHAGHDELIASTASRMCVCLSISLT